jgi:hypothetical protein
MKSAEIGFVSGVKARKLTEEESLVSRNGGALDLATDCRTLSQVPVRRGTQLGWLSNAIQHIHNHFNVSDDLACRSTIMTRFLICRPQSISCSLKNSLGTLN